MLQERSQFNNSENKEKEFRTAFETLFTELYTGSDLPRIEKITPQMVLQLKETLEISMVNTRNEYPKGSLTWDERNQWKLDSDQRNIRRAELLSETEVTTQNIIRDNSYTFFTYEPVTVKLTDLQRAIKGMDNYNYNDLSIPEIRRLLRCNKNNNIYPTHSEWCESSSDYTTLINMFSSFSRSEPTQTKIDVYTKFFYNYVEGREVFYTQLLAERFEQTPYQERKFSDNELVAFGQLPTGDNEEKLKISRHDTENKLDGMVDINNAFTSSLSTSNRKIIEICYTTHLFIRNKNPSYGSFEIYNLEIDENGNFNDVRGLFNFLTQVLNNYEPKSLTDSFALKEFIHLVKAANDLTMIYWEMKVTTANQKYNQEFKLPSKPIFGDSPELEHLETTDQACDRLFKPFTVEDVNTLWSYYRFELLKLTETNYYIPDDERCKERKANEQKIKSIERLIKDLEDLKENFDKNQVETSVNSTYYEILEIYKRETGEPWNKQPVSWPNQMSVLRNETFYGKKQEVSKENMKRLVRKLESRIKDVEQFRKAEKAIHDSALKEAVTYLQERGMYDIISRRATKLERLILSVKGCSDQKAYDENKLFWDIRYPHVYQIKEDWFSGQIKTRDNADITDFIADSKERIDDLDCQLRLLKGDLERLVKIRNKDIKNKNHYTQYQLNRVGKILME